MMEAFKIWMRWVLTDNEIEISGLEYCSSVTDFLGGTIISMQDAALVPDAIKPKIHNPFDVFSHGNETTTMEKLKRKTFATKVMCFM
jgi:hypothetical protein